MTFDCSRRTVLRGIGAGTATLLLRERFAGATLFAATTADKPDTGPAALELSLTSVSENTLRVNLAAVDVGLEQTFTDGSLVSRPWPRPLLQTHSHQDVPPVEWGKQRIRISANPLRVTVEDADGRLRQELRFDSGTTQIGFRYGEGPLFGLGEGVHPLDRRGTTEAMRNGQRGEELSVYGARVPIPLLLSASGWGLFFHDPWG